MREAGHRFQATGIATSPMPPLACRRPPTYFFADLQRRL